MSPSTPIDEGGRPITAPAQVHSPALAESVCGESARSERSRLLRLWVACSSAVEWCFGLVCLLIGLAVAASIPILQLVSLGYLLEVSGRISRSGRMRDGFFEVRSAARIGSLILGTWLMLLPLRVAADMRHSAQLFAPDSWIARAWQVALPLVSAVVILHILLAWHCGGRLRHFAWPLLTPFFFLAWLARHVVSFAAGSKLVRPLLAKISPLLLRDLTTVPPVNQWFPPAMLWQAVQERSVYSRSRDAVWTFVTEMRLPYYFWLGFRGFVGAIVWLLVPVLMVIATTKLPLESSSAAQGLGAVVGIFGSFLLAILVLYLPFLQAHFAAENRWGAMFELGQVRRFFGRAPIAFWFSLLITLLFALPLYLLKIAVIPREVVWLPSLVFVLFIFPARFITGWAVGRARHYHSSRHFLFRWLSRLAAVPVVAIYALVVYFTQYTSWYGSFSLFEQHAFLLPVPFLSL